MPTPWWQSAVIYEIYPRSFQDSDGDGIGDLEGIIERVDYLAWLGVDAVWLTPIYPSPMVDFGYDVADYTEIDPIFGDLLDFDRLVEALHERGIRLVLDFVPNHTSDQHPWFQEARRSKDNPKRNWYIFRNPVAGGYPNNWVSIAGGPAWTLDEATGQYYCHRFLKEQPDLNWRNPDVRAAMYDAMRFWLKRGIDGFRLDVFWFLIKDAKFRSDPLSPVYVEGEPDFRRTLEVYSADQPEIHEIAREVRGVAAEFGEDKLLIGEIYLPAEKLVTYYGKNGDGLHLPFNFNLMWQPWRVEALLNYIKRYESVLAARSKDDQQTTRSSHDWPSWVLGNHDQKRIASRVGPAQAKVATLILLSLRGTPTLYYGDELGLENVEIPADQGQDPFGQAHPDQGRDPVRSPLPWVATTSGSDADSAGFTTGKPWLPIGACNAGRNVEASKADPASMLNLTRDLLALRRREPALSAGNWSEVEVEGDVLAYARYDDHARFIILANLDATPKSVTFKKPFQGTIELSTQPRLPEAPITTTIDLAPNEALITRCHLDG
ncbi:MAG: alpha-amylase family glycosyl hydrolase [Geminicoccaceae bacterium]